MAWKRSFPRLTVVSAILLLGLLAQEAIACWKEPEVILKVDTPDGRSLGRFYGSTSDGGLVFESALVRIDNGKPAVHWYGRIPFFWPSRYANVGFPLVGPPFQNCCRVYGAESVKSCEGQLLRIVEPVGNTAGSWFYEALPGGGFLKIEEHESPERQKGRGNEPPWRFFGRYRFYEFDCEGNYLREWSKPPKGFCFCYVDENAIVFPDREFVYTREAYFDAGLNFCGRGSQSQTSFGWISQSGGAINAFDGQGKLLCHRLEGVIVSGRAVHNGPLRDEWFGQIVAEIMVKDGSPHFHLYQSWLDNQVFDEHGNAFMAFSTGIATYLLKLPWADEDTPPLFEPIRVIPLDGWGRPLPEKPGPPAVAVGEPGTTVSFIYPKQVLPLENGLYPIYSLWDYQMSAFQRDNPSAIRGHVAGEGYDTNEQYVPAFAPPVTIDANPLMDNEYVLISGPNPKVKPYRATWTNKPYGMMTINDLMLSCHDKHMNPLASVQILGRNTLDLGLDPQKPDFLRLMNVWLQGYCEQADLLAIETGPNTKVFIVPTVMTRLWLSPKGLPSDQRATLKAYCKNWLNGKEDQVELKETESGSRKFISQDGSTVYEVAFIFGEVEQVIPFPTPSSVDRLYLYITDPQVGLAHQPQLLFENGVDTGEYWSYAEPPWKAINSGFNSPWSYKHWPQVSEEIEKEKFFVEASGPNVSEGTMLRVTWTAPDGKDNHHDLPLTRTADGKYRTTMPLLGFEAQGCDIGGTWTWTEKAPTPQIPSVLTFREKNVRWQVFSKTNSEDLSDAPSAPREH